MNNDRDVGKFILYLCPTGQLNRQLENYFTKSRQFCGANTAHKYMPHCTLTGFFRDRLSSVELYLAALERVYLDAKANGVNFDLKINRLTFNPNWHGLELQSPAIKNLTRDFARWENSLTRTEDLKLKDWLHLSLAYDFLPERQQQLQELALATIDLEAEVNWELRFYQLYPDWSWKCYRAWRL